MLALLVVLTSPVVSGICSVIPDPGRCRSDEYWDEGLWRCSPCRPICSEGWYVDCARMCPRFTSTASPINTTTVPWTTSTTDRHGSQPEISLVQADAVLLVVASIVVFSSCVTITLMLYKEKSRIMDCTGTSLCSRRGLIQFCCPCYKGFNGHGQQHHLTTTQADPRSQTESNSESLDALHQQSHIPLLHKNSDVDAASDDPSHPLLNSMKLTGVSSIGNTDVKILNPNEDVEGPGNTSDVGQTLLHSDDQEMKQICGCCTSRDSTDARNVLLVSCQVHRHESYMQGSQQIDIPQISPDFGVRQSLYMTRSEDNRRSHSELAFPGRNPAAEGEESEPSLAVPQQPASAQEPSLHSALDSGLGHVSSSTGSVSMRSASLSSLEPPSDAVTLPPQSVLQRMRVWMQQCHWVWGFARARNNVQDIYVFGASLEHAKNEVLRETGMREDQFRVCLLQRPPELIPLSGDAGVAGGLRCSETHKTMTLGAFLSVSQELYALTSGHAVQEKGTVELRTVSKDSKVEWKKWGRVVLVIKNHWKPIPIDIAVVEVNKDAADILEWNKAKTINVFKHQFDLLIGTSVQKNGMASGSTSGVVENNVCRVSRSELRQAHEKDTLCDMEQLNDVLVVSGAGFACKGDSGGLVTGPAQQGLVYGYTYGKIRYHVIPQYGYASEITQFLVFSLKGAMLEISRRKFEGVALDLFQI